mgnify:CR=1 FL=1
MVAAEVYVKNTTNTTNNTNTYIKKTEGATGDAEDELVMMRKIEYGLMEYLELFKIDKNLIKDQLLKLISDLFKHDIYFTDLKPDNLMITYNMENLNHLTLPNKLSIIQ